MKDYMIVQSNDSVGDLTKQVKEYMELHWEPLGPPTIAVCETDSHYYFSGFQAMTRKITY